MQSLVNALVRTTFRAFFFMAFSAAVAWASVGGSISGVVKDPSGRLIRNAEVNITETGTGISHHTHTDSNGYYILPVLPVGHYSLAIHATGFRGYELKDIVLDTNAVLRLDAVLVVGSVDQTVSVNDDTIHVETISTQLGQVISGRQITAVPLDGRSYTDLLSLQAGVAPATSITATTVQDVGATVLNPSGDLNPGNISVNGQREFSNFFLVNGSDAEEGVNAGTAIIPNLDSIEEFRILTSNFDAEYGEFSGGQISVITKSGTNSFHGSAFDFLRNTALDARNYFSPTRVSSVRANSVAQSVAPSIKTRSSSSPTIKAPARLRESTPAPSVCPQPTTAPAISVIRPAISQALLAAHTSPTCSLKNLATPSSRANPTM
jgi:Carboxypeptidase regulatory-like domain